MEDWCKIGEIMIMIMKTLVNIGTKLVDDDDNDDEKFGEKSKKILVQNPRKIWCEI